MLYRLSKIIPIPMRSSYIVNGIQQCASWIQWRNHIWRHRIFN